MSAEQICAAGFAVFLLLVGIAVVITSKKDQKGGKK